MSSRLIGILVGLLLIAVSAIDVYARVARTSIAFPLQIETSYFSLDAMDDSGDAARPGRAINWSAREKVTGKLVLGAKVRRVRLTPPPVVFYERSGPLRLISQDIFRFQEVFRI